MDDLPAASTGTVVRGRIARWLLPAVGSVALVFGGFWAIEVTTFSDSNPAGSS